MNLKLDDKITNYTEAEFYRFLEDFFEDTDTNNLPDIAYDKHISRLATHFSKLVGHPKGKDLIFHPSPNQEDSPSGVIASLKQWYADNGLELFKE